MNFSWLPFEMHFCQSFQFFLTTHFLLKPLHFYEDCHLHVNKKCYKLSYHAKPYKLYFVLKLLMLTSKQCATTCNLRLRQADNFVYWLIMYFLKYLFWIIFNPNYGLQL